MKQTKTIQGKIILIATEGMRRKTGSGDNFDETADREYATAEARDLEKSARRHLDSYEHLEWEIETTCVFCDGAWELVEEDGEMVPFCCTKAIEVEKANSMKAAP